MAGNKEYSRLKKKYSKLPDWAWLRKNFTVKIEEDGPAIEQIKNAMTDRLDGISGKIEPLISGAENFCCYFERRMLSPMQKEKMFDIYKDIQSLLWKSSAISADISEKKCAEWIMEAKAFWEKNREFVIEMFETISNGWKTYKKAEVETTYHG